MSLTLGESIFKDIESNEYLQEIFNAILYNYSLSLFKLRNKEQISFSLVDALRFADLLSKSTDPLKFEHHKVWAQEIVALLSTLYPEDESIKFCMGSVLTNVCNYMGLSLRKSTYKPINTFENAFEEYKKSFLQIPFQSNNYFFKSQKSVFDSMKKERFSYSGPTSMGKSFVMRVFIKEQISNGAKNNFAIIVPTKALINEVSSRIITDLNNLLSQMDYRVITAGGEISLQQKHNFVLVLTPERLLYLLLGNPNFKLDYLFIDEAHKISSKDTRSPFYYKIVNLLSKREQKPHFIFSSPNIPNPEVYLKLIGDNNISITDKLTTSYSPVSQIKYVVDLVDGIIKIYNDYSCQFINIAKLTNPIPLSTFINKVGANSKNIVYCSSTAKAIEYAREYAKILPPIFHNELSVLSKEIRNQIHTDYYLADLLTKGVAYHIGYLPADLRMRIEDLFRTGAIKTVFCTSTLVEGVNLPADNLFITSYKNGLSHMTPVDFRNLIGRVGRIEFNLYGNVFLVRSDNRIEPKKYIELIEQEVPPQRLSIVTELTNSQKQKIVESLLQGNIELLKYPKSQTNDNYTLMRKFALILLSDIIAGRNSLIRQEFSANLTSEKETAIKEAFSQKNVDEDINISSDQISKLSVEISKGLSYPQLNALGNIDYKELVSFLEKLCSIFKWEKYEPTTLGFVSTKNGKHTKLKWYAVILAQWVSGNGLNLIIKDAIQHKIDNPKSGVEIDGQIVTYNDSVKHRNIVISDTLNAIEDVILFRISNYFLRFSAEYKKFHNIDSISNDWYEYVEYGTMNPFTIFLQRNGFSRETSTYIKQHREYTTQIDGEYKLKTTLLSCPSKSVCKEATEIKYNIPELFVES